MANLLPHTFPEHALFASLLRQRESELGGVYCKKKSQKESERDGDGGKGIRKQEGERERHAYQR